VKFPQAVNRILKHRVHKMKHMHETWTEGHTGNLNTVLPTTVLEA